MRREELTKSTRLPPWPAPGICIFREGYRYNGLELYVRVGGPTRICCRTGEYLRGRRREADHSDALDDGSSFRNLQCVSGSGNQVFSAIATYTELQSNAQYRECAARKQRERRLLGLELQMEAAQKQ